jgi:putative heme-binding domain-containing protein
VRNSGFTRLKAQGTKAIPAITALLKDNNPYIAARAVWLLAQMGDQGQEIASQWLSAKEPRHRLVAVRALRAAGADVVKLAKKMVKDPSAMVRREVALMLRDVPAAQSVPLLAQIAAQFDGKDRAYLEALGLGSTNKEAAVYDAAKALTKQGSGDKWSDAFAWIAWRLHPNQAVADLKLRALAASTSPEQSKLMLTALGFNSSPAASGAMIQIANTEGFVHKDLAKWWINNRKGNLWKSHNLDAILKSMGQDPANAKLVSVEMPAMPANAPKLPSAAEIAKLTGDKERGKAAIASCYMCHKVGEQGIDYGPDLTTFGRQQPADVIINAIANPSAEVSHGYEGSEIKTKDGITIVGMVLSDGDPVIVKCVGGQTQTIAKSRIASMKPLEKSLMYDPANLGLTPQAIADIAAYLKSL